MASRFQGVEQGPPIEVFLLNRLFTEDTFQNKVNLGVGGEPYIYILTVKYLHAFNRYLRVLRYVMCLCYAQTNYYVLLNVRKFLIRICTLIKLEARCYVKIMFFVSNNFKNKCFLQISVNKCA